MNDGLPHKRRHLEARARIIQAIRDFFTAHGFLEVETPTLVRYPGQEPHLSPMGVQLHDVNGTAHDGYLITSPEYACKRLLAAGYKKIFTIARVFRDGEPWGGSHNPEFTMLEWYRAHADYRVIMRDTEQLIASVVKKLRTTHYALRTVIDFTPPWPRISVKQAFKQNCNLNLDQLLTRPAMAKAVASRGYHVTKNDTFDDLFFKIFIAEIEPKLGVAQSTPSVSPLVRGKKDDFPSLLRREIKGEISLPLLTKDGLGEAERKTARPMILYDYPVQMAALARHKPSDPRYAERFEVYAAGLELANAFSELTDPREQLKRFRAEQAQKKKLGREVHPIDMDFIHALRDMPPSGGIALGVDRLVMLLTGAKGIKDVLLFPAGDIFKSHKGLIL